MKFPLFKAISWAEGPEGLHRRLPAGSLPFFLHSGGRDRYSYLGFDPLGVLKVYPKALRWCAGGKVQTLLDNPFDWLQKKVPAAPASSSSFPFASGWLGVLAYEAAPFADSALPA